MKIKYGPIVGAASGALGNIVLSHNRGGAYARVRTVPTKVVNAYTTGIRDDLTAASREWGALTAAQQAAWNTFAQANQVTDRLGEKITLFGNAMYSKLNIRLKQAGDTEISLPPTDVAPSALTALSAAISAGGGTFVLTTAVTPLAADDRLWIRAACLKNAGQNYFQNLLKLVKISDKAQATGLDIATEIVARFGTLQEGDRFVLHVSVFDSATGLLSAPRLAEATVAA